MGIGVTGDFFPLGNFPIIEDTYILGGYRAFTDIAARDAIPALDRKVGMLVRTDNTGQVWRLSGGITNADWVLDSTSPPVTVVTDIYVSGLNGSDSNDGLTPGTAVATLTKAFSLVPATLSAPLVIHLGRAGAPSTPYAWAPFPTPTQLTQNARVWLYGDGAGQAGEDGFDVVAGAPVAAAAGTTAAEINTAAIVANAYRGFTLEVVNGPAAGYRRTILTNSTSSITPVRRFETEDATTAVTPLNGNTIRILRPSVIFDGYDTAGNATGIPGLFSGIGSGDSGAPLLLVNLAFEAVTNQTEINRCSVFCAGVEFRGTVAPIFTNCNGSFGNWDNIFETAAVQATLPRDTNLSVAKTSWFDDIGASLVPSPLVTWRGWGVSQPDIVAATAATTGLRFLSCQMSAFAVVGDIHMNQSTFALGGHFWGDVEIERGFCHLLGRAPTVSDCSFFERKIRTELATVLTDASVTGPFTFTYAAAVDAQWESVNSNTLLVNGGTFTSALAGFVRMTGGGTFEIFGGDWALFHQLDYAAEFGLFQIEDGLFIQNATSMLAQNDITGVVQPAPAFWVVGLGRAEIDADTTVGTDPGALLPGYGVVVQNGGSMRNRAALTLNDAALLVDAGIYEAAGNLTIVSASNNGGIELLNDATFLQSAGVLDSTGNAGLEATDASFMLQGTSAALRGTLGQAIELIRANGAIVGVTTIDGDVTLSDDSALVLSQNSDITAAALTMRESRLMTNMLGDLVFTDTVDLQGSEILHASNSTQTVSYNTTGANTFLKNSAIRGRIDVTMRNLIADDGSVIAVGASSGQLTLSGAAALNASSIICGKYTGAGIVNLIADATLTTTQGATLNVDGQFQAATGASLSDTNAVFGQLIVTAGGLTCQNANVQVSATCSVGGTDDITLTSSKLTVGTSQLLADNIFLTDSALTTNGETNFNRMVLRQSTWHALGDMGTSIVNAPAGLNGLSIANGSTVNLQEVTAGQLHIVGRAGFNSVDIFNNGEFSFNNANILIDTGDYGIAFLDGARVYCVGAPSNVTGAVDDFIDTQGAFPDTIVGATLATGRCIYTGQHAGGVYVAGAAPSGASFVQRM